MMLIKKLIIKSWSLDIIWIVALKNIYNEAIMNQIVDIFSKLSNLQGHRVDQEYPNKFVARKEQDEAIEIILWK